MAGSFPAVTVIEGDTVVVSSPGVAEPVAVRFAWHEAAMPNLHNKAALPAAPFRMENLPVSEETKAESRAEHRANGK